MHTRLIGYKNWAILTTLVDFINFFFDFRASNTESPNATSTAAKPQNIQFATAGRMEPLAAGTSEAGTHQSARYLGVLLYDCWKWLLHMIDTVCGPDASPMLLTSRHFTVSYLVHIFPKFPDFLHRRWLYSSSSCCLQYRSASLNTACVLVIQIK